MMRITLPGLCGLIAATGLLLVGLGHLHSGETPPPNWVAMARVVAPASSPKAMVNPSGLSPEEAAARGEWVKQIGSVQLIKRNVGADQEINDETITLRDRRGRKVGRVDGHWVDLELVRDLDGDNSPEVVLHAWSGGAHGSFVYYVYSTTAKPQCLVAYDKGNDEDGADGCPNFEVRDLDGDGRQEIVTTYDGFAYWSEVPEWQTCYAGSARVPMVLGLRHGRYVDVTRCHRALLLRYLAKAKRHLLADLTVKAVGSDLPTGIDRQRLIEYYSVALLLYSRPTARRMVLRLLPEWDRGVFRRNCSKIEQVLADRAKRLAHPRAYSQAQAFVAEASPPR